MSLCADSTGNVWVGLGPLTGAGLIRFDGTTSQYFDLESLANHSNVVSALAYDKRGVLWIGTQWHGNTGFPSGVLRYDGTTWTSYSSNDRTIPWGEVSSLAVAPNGDVWAGLWYRGLCHFDGTNWTFYDPSNSALPSDQIISLAQDATGNLWASTSAGGARFDGTTWTAFTPSNSGILEGTAGVGVDSYGNVWFTAFDVSKPGGVCRYDGTSWKTYDPDNSMIGTRFIASAMAGVDGEMWFGSVDQGVVRYTPARSILSVSGPRTVTAACTNDPIDISIDLSNPGPSAYDVHSIATDDPNITVTSSLPLRVDAGDTKTLHVQLTSPKHADTTVVLVFNGGTETAFRDTVELKIQPSEAIADVVLMDLSDSLHAHFGVGPVTSLRDIAAHTIVVHVMSTNEDVAAIERSTIAVSSQFSSWSIVSIQPESAGFAVTLTSQDPIDDPRGLPLLTFVASRFASAEDSAYITARYEIPDLPCAQPITDSTAALGLQGCGTSILGHAMRGEALLSQVTVRSREGSLFADVHVSGTVDVQYDVCDILGQSFAHGLISLTKGESETPIAHSLRSGTYLVRFQADDGEVRTARVVLMR
jgi:hypothetical protein